jgi:hypothetical protein
MAHTVARPSRVAAVLTRANALALHPELAELAARFGDDVIAAWRSLVEPHHLALFAYGAGVDPRRILRAHVEVIRGLAEQARIIVVPLIDEALSMIEEWDDDQLDSGQVGLTSETISQQVLRYGRWSRDDATKALSLATHAQLNALGLATSVVGHNDALGAAEVLAREIARRELPFQVALAAAAIQPLLHEVTRDDTDLGPRTGARIRATLEIAHLEAAVAGKPTHPTPPYAFG